REVGSGPACAAERGVCGVRGRVARALRRGAGRLVPALPSRRAAGLGRRGGGAVSAGRDQRAFFREVERDYWASAAGLKAEERALIERALEPRRRTLEGGTGGGRIVRALRERGFSELAGFDFAPELIAAARAADPDGSIAFAVADATRLPYADGEFEQLVYLQQIVCTIEDAAGRRRALAEAARVLRPGGVALFSFLLLEGRRRSPLQRAFVA